MATCTHNMGRTNTPALPHEGLTSIETAPAAVTRRSFARSASAIALAAVGASSVGAAPLADAELIRSCDDAINFDRQRADLTSDLLLPYPPDVEAEEERLAGLADDALERAIRLRATTLAGLVAKARLAQSLMVLASDGGLHHTARQDVQIAYSLTADLLAQGV